MVLLLLLMTLSCSELPNSCSDHCDLVELNSFHDCTGRHVFDQVIFYEWAPDQSRYHVRAWIISDDDGNAGRRPAKRYRDGLYITRWNESGINRVVTATHYRRSWTQIDPERANKKLLDEQDRHQFARPAIKKPEQPPSEPNE